VECCPPAGRIISSPIPSPTTFRTDRSKRTRPHSPYFTAFFAFDSVFLIPLYPFPGDSSAYPRRWPLSLYFPPATAPFYFFSHPSQPLATGFFPPRAIRFPSRTLEGMSFFQIPSSFLLCDPSHEADFYKVFSRLPFVP